MVEAHIPICFTARKDSFSQRVVKDVISSTLVLNPGMHSATRKTDICKSHHGFLISMGT